MNKRIRKKELRRLVKSLRVVRIRPGDTLVANLGDSGFVKRETIDRIKYELSQHFPGVECIVLQKTQCLSVFRNEARAVSGDAE